MSSRSARWWADWKDLFPEQRLAVATSVAIVLSMLLPWYQQKGIIARPNGSTVELDDSLNAFQAWGFVEASILLVAVGVIALCLARAGRRAFHLPGGDGAVIMAAGAWVMFLVFYRQLDRPTGNETGVLRPAGSPAWSPVGVDWGIFVTFALGAVLLWCGWRMRARHRPEPLIDGDDPRTPGVEGDPASVVGPPDGGTSPLAPPPGPAPSPDPAEPAPAEPGPVPEPQTRAGRIARDEEPPVPRLGRRMAEGPESAEAVEAGLRSVGYLPDESTALVSFLAARLGKPVLVEGPAGVGKTQLAKSLADLMGRRLVRLQCYEGLDEAKSLYEWNYRKQLLRIQAEADGTGWTEVQEDIFGPEFLLERPLMTAIASEEPVVLLIDEIDKTDQEFEAMLLELLSDFQISVPELGRIEASTMPLVLLTSNNSRELTEALKRRCLYLWIDYPSLEHELEIVRLHAPELPEAVARRLVEIVALVRDLDLKKPPSIAESIDWARALLLLGASDIDRETFMETMSIIVKHRTDLDIVSERVGVKLGSTEEAVDAPAAG